MSSSHRPAPDVPPPPYNRRSIVPPDARPFEDAHWQTGGSYTVKFRFSPTNKQGKIDLCRWEAFLMVRTRDLRRLMRGGFFWTAENIHRDAGFMQLDDIDEKYSRHGWKKCRVWYLSCPEQGGGGDGGGGGGAGAYFWAARLCIYAKSASAHLADFQPIRDLSPGMITYVDARNFPGQKELYYVYKNDSLRDPAKYASWCNVLYGDMPLPGWWPRPKEQPQTAALPEQRVAAAGDRPKGGDGPEEGGEAAQNLGRRGLLKTLLGRR